MPYDVQVIPISEFLRADVAGTLEPGANRVFLKENRPAARPRLMFWRW